MAEHRELELAEFGPTLYVNRSRLSDILGNEAARALESDSTDARLIAWLNEVELRYRFVLYEGDGETSGWTRRCLRQADRVLLVGRAGSPPPAAPPAVLHADHGGAEHRELILVHSQRRPIVEGTRPWLTALNVTGHHQVALDTPDDVRRLARRLAGRAIGLVLGGGGLRSAAHIGVTRALREAGVPIDYVGGTSAGSLIAAQFACAWDHKRMLQENWQLFVHDNALGEYTVPLVSLVTAGRLGKGLQAMFGQTCIEDLWTPFFAISSNLTRAVIQIHREGSVWRAVRASCSIPGILPPILENGELLVDGALLNNLPTDIMAGLCDGGPVIAVDLRLQVDLASEYDFGESISTGELFWRRLNPFARQKLLAPNMLAVLTRATVLASVQANVQQVKQASLYFNPPVGHFGLLDRKQGDAMYRIGNEYARERIAELERKGLLDRLSIPYGG